MIVEFVGTPGAGKTTLEVVAREILCELGLKAMLRVEAGIFCFKRTRLGRIICFITPLRWQERTLWGVLRRLLFFYWIKFTLRNGKLTRCVMCLLAHQQISKRDKLKILGYFLRVSSYHQFFLDHLKSDEALILSEGLVHRLTSLHSSPFEEPNPFEILNYVKLLPQSYLVILVETSLDNCVERVFSRGGHGRYQDKELTLFLANSHKTIKIALQELRDLAWDIIEVNNDNELNISFANLRTSLRNSMEKCFNSNN
jgi:hypothetical protein